VSMPAHDADHTGWDAKTLLTAPADSADVGRRRPVSLDSVASGREAAGIAALALALLADSRAWVAAQSPQFSHVPVEAMAISGAAVSPWRTPAEVIPCMRMYLWIFAFDDHVESFAPGDGARLDDLMRRCAAVVRGGRDDSHWLLSTLSTWQRDLAAWPLYPALSGLWIEKFDSMLSSMRWEWEAARSGRRDSAGLRDYLAHADSIAAWVSVLPRWITYGGDDVLDHLDTLVAALGDYVIADRLANDLASFARERDQSATDNVLRYGVSPDWVKTEIARHVNAVRRLLDDVVADGVGPAIELVRETEYATTFYAMAEFRGWGSDAGD
jgi:Terpene synthase family 2, C-terminal metal binding